jgi:hypothetical protein
VHKVTTYSRKMSSKIAVIAIKVVKDVDEKGWRYRALYRSNQVPRYAFLHLSFISVLYHVYFHLVHIFYILPFYHVLNISSQALVAVSSSGHIRISVHVLTSL